MVTRPYPRARAQSEIAAALARAGDIDGALALARALGEDDVGDAFYDGMRGRSPGTLAEIARVQAKAGDLPDGRGGGAPRGLRDRAQTMPRRDVVFFERVLWVVEAQCEIGDTDGAKASAGLIENDNVDMVLALAAIARAQAKAGDAQGARATLHDPTVAFAGSLARPNSINDNPGTPNSPRVLARGSPSPRPRPATRRMPSRPSPAAGPTPGGLKRSPPSPPSRPASATSPAL